jgi:allophanate hydrolase subunit 2
VLCADAQTTGGYAKLACVIGPDLRLLAQARIGEQVRFVCCSEEEAVEARRAEQRLLAEVAAERCG